MRRRFAVTATRTTGGIVLGVVLELVELVGVVVALGLLIDFDSPATPTPRTSSRRPTTTRGHSHGLSRLGPLVALVATLRGNTALGPVAVRRTRVPSGSPVRLIGVTVRPHTRLLLHMRLLRLGGGMRLGRRVRVELLG
uniref:hypothetical protein n=1 Tax=Streptomyces canus TaxID=58343 RepID=UPI0027D79240|nr:hypothetical protein [Streptomyces canus]